MPVLHFLLCIDTNIYTLGQHHGTALRKIDHLFDLEGGQEGQMMRAEVAPLCFDDSVDLCWFEKLLRLWPGVPSSQGMFPRLQGLFVDEGTVLSKEQTAQAWNSAGDDVCHGVSQSRLCPSTAAFSPSSSVSAVAPVQLLLVLLEIRSAKRSFHFL